jgi:hypothetical protein
MTRSEIGRCLAACLCLAALPAAAAETSSSSSPQAAKRPVAGSIGMAVRGERPVAQKSRLKYRGADGTCACSCASGGITEEGIRKAEEARGRAGS